mgnify:CR=1 FL=1
MLDWFDLEDKGCLACIGLILLAIILIAGVFFAESLVIMWLWNAVIVVVMEWNTLSFWLACGLNLLCHLLFGSVVKISSNKN